MDWKDRIVSDKDILMGKPVIKGTRLSVEHILDRLANGWTEELVLESYPFISKLDLQAVFAFLNEMVKDGLLYEVRAKI